MSNLENESFVDWEREKNEEENEEGYYTVLLSLHLSSWIRLSLK